MSRYSANALLLIAALIWGFAFVFQTTAMDDMGPYLFTGIRFLLAGIVVLPFAYREHSRSDVPWPISTWLKLGSVGLVFFAASAIQQVGLLTTTVTNAGFLTALYVIIVPILLLLFLRKSSHPVIWPAAVTCVAGTWLMSGELQSIQTGDMLMLVSAVFWAMQVVMIGLFATRLKQPLTIACVQFFVCGIFGTVTGLLVDPFSLEIVNAVAVELFYTGVISGAIAFTLQAIAMRYTPSADAAVIFSSEGVFAAIFGALLLGERLSFSGYIGCGLIFLAILSVQLVPMLMKKRTSPA